jgi:prolyl 4-hydroxylase
MPINPLGNRQQLYDKYVKSCSTAFGWALGSMECHDSESDRIDMTLQQPKSMYNYTKIGFKKIEAPIELYKLLKDFWHTNKHRAEIEEWGDANTYSNNWESQSLLLSVDETTLRGGGVMLQNKIWDSARDILSEWTGQDLTPCSLYGIRVYTEGAILAPHVDRLPLVSSAIINVDQDVDEAWPLEVYGHDGRAYNVTMDAGDMVLYESHSVIHGRPFPLKGRYMANIFIHFEPTGHTLRHHPDTVKNVDLDQDVNKKYRDSISKRHGGHENHAAGTKKVPSYIIEGSSRAESWKSEDSTINNWQSVEADDGSDETSKDTVTSFTTGSKLVLHQLARDGQFDKLKQHLDETNESRQQIHSKDKNGFTPLHEGVLGGNIDIVKYLVELGADVNATTFLFNEDGNNDNNKNSGGSVLWLAKQEHSPDHPIIEFLESIGAVDVGPEL